MATQIKFKRGARANLNTLATSGDLITGEPIYITDEDRIAICTSDSTYETFVKESEVLANTNRFSGVTILPSITDNGNGSVTIGNGGYYNLSQNIDGSGYLLNYNILGNTYTLTNGVVNYIVANYNNGTPILQVITDVSLINETTIIPIFTIFRNDNYLHYQNWDNLGLSLANKVHQSIVKTQRYRLENGLVLTESGTRNLNLTAGIIWTGGVKNSLSAIASATDNMFFWYHSGGTWVQSTVTQYNNTQYDNGTNLVELTTNRYTVNWIYRGVETQKHLYIVLGTGDYTLAQAQSASIPSLPTAISSHAVLVAKLIVQKSSNTALSIQNAFETQFGGSGVYDHTNLSNLAWTSSGHTGTASKLAGFGTSGEAVFVDPPTGGGGVWVTFTGTRTANTTFTVADNQTSIFTKGLIIKWSESTDVKCGMVISSSYSTVTTVTIVGDTCSSTASNFKYSIIPVEVVRFAIAGTIGTTGTNVMNAYFANYDCRVLGADLQTGTAGTTNNTTIDINKAGVTMFTTKPTLATTVLASTSVFTADSDTSLTINNKVTIDIDAVQSTPCIDLYVQLYIFQTRLLNLN